MVDSLAVKKTYIFAGMVSSTDKYIVKVNPNDGKVIKALKFPHLGIFYRQFGMAIDANNDVYTLQNDYTSSSQYSKILKINNALDAFQWRIQPDLFTNVFHLQEIFNGNLIMAGGNEYYSVSYFYIKFYNLDGTKQVHYQYEPSIGQSSPILQGAGLENVVYSSSDQTLIACYRNSQAVFQYFIGYIIQETSAAYNLHSSDNSENMYCADIHPKGNKSYTVYEKFQKNSISYFTTSDLISRLYVFGDATINNIPSSYIFKMRQQEYCYTIYQQDTSNTVFTLEHQFYQELKTVPTTTPAPTAPVVTTTTTPQPNNGYGDWPSSQDSYSHDSYSHYSNSYDSYNGNRNLDYIEGNYEEYSELRKEGLDSISNSNQEMKNNNIQDKRKLGVDVLNTSPMLSTTDISSFFSFDKDLRSTLVELDTSLIVSSPNKTTCNLRGANDLKYVPNSPDNRDFSCYSELENCNVSLGYYQFGNQVKELQSPQNQTIYYKVFDPAKNFSLPVHNYTPSWCKQYSQIPQVSATLPSIGNSANRFIPEISFFPLQNLMLVKCDDNSLADHYEFYFNSSISYGGYFYQLSTYYVDVIISQYIKFQDGYDSPPFFINLPIMTLIQVGDTEIYQLPAIFDIQNDLYDIKINLGKASIFTTIKNQTNLAISPSIFDRGQYDVKVKLIQRNQQSLFNSYSFKISVYSDQDDPNYLEQQENKLDNYDRIKRQIKDQSLKARVLKVNQIGEVVILFDKIMAIPYNYTQVMNESLSIKLVQDNIITIVDYNITKFKGQMLQLKLYFRLDQLRIIFKENKYYIDSKSWTIIKQNYEIASIIPPQIDAEIYYIFSTIQGATKNSILAIFGSNMAINLFMYYTLIILSKQEMWPFVCVGNDR
ncbi:UNKNOWN [Stylonychia lemnae]|uniref:Uncharacterized protein n=1 Tax=Stylonychia lemnae TaxID=5949 RepID=A0A077ZPS7_STYLE|nr:UNKNOWN [Stylonychia lemnae]|eukprot:CDW71464.1 UNKNOWN [Stylonychia lemnae]